jgi:monoamine oxidase
MPTETDVIIIGAGSAGLSAALELDELGIDYRLVEGSHRIGGRAYSEEIAPGEWFDLGCSYLHQGLNNPFAEIADRLGIAIGREHGDIFEHIRAHHNGLQLDEQRQSAYFAYFTACDSAIEASVALGEDVAIAALVDLESKYFDSWANSMAGLNSLDIDETSSLDYHRAAGDVDYPVANGYGNLVAAWGASVPVSLNTRVDAIDWSGLRVRVDTGKGSLSGKAVLCTVSTGVLAALDIEFSPKLPDWKIEAVQGLPTGTENKIGVHFDRDVFGTEGRGFHNVWNDDGEAAGFEASVMGQNIAIVFTGGRHAIWLEKQGQQAGHDFAIDRVAEAFGNDIRRHVTRSIVTAWTTEPWTKGSYSCALPGQAHQREILARPLDGRLFFAGEATTPGDNSTCHGAFRSGIRAAREIAAAL